MYRILFITQTAKRGGAELSLIDLIKVIKDDISSGSEILFLEEGELLEEDLPIKKEFIRFDLPLKRNPPYFSFDINLWNINRIYNMARNYDIIWTNTQKSHILGWYIKKKTNKTWIVHFRDLLPEWQMDILRKFISSADVIISVSSLVEKTLLPLKSVVIYNGIDINGFINVKPLALKRPAVGMISHLDKNKGVEDLIEVATRFPDLSFYLCGQKMFDSKDFNFPNNLYYLGYIKDVRPFIKGLDLGLVLSHSEGFGRVALEMSASRLPFIAYNTGIHPLLTNCICDVGDTACVCRMLNDLLKNKPKCYTQTNIDLFDIRRTKKEVLNLLKGMKRG